MAFDPRELVESGGPDPRMLVFLEMLMELLSSKRDPRHVQDEREEDSMEVPVRPRVEPLGGG